MLDLTAAAEVDGTSFDGVDLFLSDPHISIDSTEDDLQRLADKIARKELRGRVAGGSRVAADRRRLGDGRSGGTAAISGTGAKACRIGNALRELGIRTLRRHPDRFGGEPGGMG